jgi:large subunit ribosomal protein L10
MKPNLLKKQSAVKDLSNVLVPGAMLVVISYHGIDSVSLTAVRTQARALGVYMRVIKNKVARLAMSGNFEAIKSKLIGPLLYVASDDPTMSAKIADILAKANPAVKIIAGIYNGQLFSADEVVKIAAIPGRERLLSLMLGALKQIPAGFVRVVAAVRDKKSSNL